MKRLMLLWYRFGKADLRLLRLAWLHHDRPGWLRPATVLLALYAIAPFSFVIPVLGLVDDLVFVPMLLHFMLTLLPAHIRNGVESGMQGDVRADVMGNVAR